MTVISSKHNLNYGIKELKELFNKNKNYNFNNKKYSNYETLKDN